MSKRASTFLDSYRNKKQRPRLSKYAGRVNHNTRQSKPDEVGKNRDASENVGIGVGFKHLKKNIKEGETMGHKNRAGGSLRQQVYDELQKKNGFGRSKHEDKKAGISSRYIYSFNSMKTYLKHSFYFVEWCKNQDYIKGELKHKPRTLAECKPYIEDFLRDEERRGLSAYTIKMQKSALSKLYGADLTHIKTRATSRADIKRSRGEAKRDCHFSEEKNAAFVNCCRCVGFRRSEMEQAKPEDLMQVGDIYFMQITGKGGRRRAAMLVGTPDEIERAVDYINKMTGQNKVPNGADVHSYRADYATRIYNRYARPIEEIKGKSINYTELTGKTAKGGEDIYKSAIYYCRRDRAGQALDRRAMIMASQSLGHNRESVVGEHYLKLE